MPDALTLDDITIPEGFVGNGSPAYYPDGPLLGWCHRKPFIAACRRHDYLYSRLSDEDYPEITKEQADIMLSQHLTKEGYPEHAQAFYGVLKDIGHLFYKKTPQADPKRTHDFESAMYKIDSSHRYQYRAVDALLVGGVVAVGLFVYSRLQSKHS